MKGWRGNRYGHCLGGVLSMKSGWHGERRRHGLASKGIKSKASGIYDEPVKVIYGDEFNRKYRILDGKIETSDIPELVKSIKLINYNYFNGKEVADELMKLHEMGYIMHVKFGRESSPVLYIAPPYYTNQSTNNNTNNNNYMYNEEKREEMFSEIKNIGKKLEADEIDIVNGYEVRLWWD